MAVDGTDTEKFCMKYYLMS